jgi:hypothetical protein
MLAALKKLIQTIRTLSTFTPTYCNCMQATVTCLGLSLWALEQNRVHREQSSLTHYNAVVADPQYHKDYTQNKMGLSLSHLNESYSIRFDWARFR